jgi:hypothetical protein
MLVQERSMTTPKEPPLQEFDARIVQAPLQGLLRNMDSELLRRVKQAMPLPDRETERRLTLLLLMLRFTRNSYEAVSFLCSSADDSQKRKREFVLILPPANRQLLDLLFTLVFMMDDFTMRSLAYERSGYRQGREEYDKFYAKYGSNAKWQTHFHTLRESLSIMEKYISITPEQKADPKLIPYWRAPYRLMNTPTKSKPFMEYLEKWLYGETSAQAHLNAAGLFSVGAFLLADLAPEADRTVVLDRNLPQYVFRHFSRNLVTVLAIASEIDTFARLSNRETLVRLWVLLGGYAEEAEDVYKERYQVMLG